MAGYIPGVRDEHRFQGFFVNWSTINLQCCVSFCCRAKWFSDQFSSVAQSCPTLCIPMDCKTPGLPVHHQLLILVKLLSIKSMMPSNHLVLCHPLLLPPSIFPSIRVFSNDEPNLPPCSFVVGLFIWYFCFLKLLALIPLPPPICNYFSVPET